MEQSTRGLELKGYAIAQFLSPHRYDGTTGRYHLSDKPTEAGAHTVIIDGCWRNGSADFTTATSLMTAAAAINIAQARDAHVRGVAIVYLTDHLGFQDKLLV